MASHVIILIAVALAAVTAVVAAATRITFGRLAGVGIAAGVLLWLVMAVIIFRGPDNPDLGELGWTIVVGVVIAIWVAGWIVGAAGGHWLSRTRARNGQHRRGPISN